MEYLLQKTAQVGKPFEKNGEDAYNDGILFEGVHISIKT
jgi:hypothetical protein